MNKQSLPVVDSARTEFGFYRTHCDCPECTRSCYYIPGYLIPADLERIHRHLASDQDLLCWAKQDLLASPGALVAQNGQMFRIPTLVPSRRPDGACVCLTDSDQCGIHAVSPYGCAFFDSHLALSEADRRSKRGLQAVLDAWNAGDVYAQVWLALAADGLMAPTPEVARRQLRQSIPDKAASASAAIRRVQI
jgi:hypothetical protein